MLTTFAFAHRRSILAFGLVGALLPACDREPAGVDEQCDAPDIAFPARASGSIAFTNVNVITMAGSADLQRNRTVLVRNGAIEGVGDASTSIPSGATVIDGRCRYLMPGLADMHVHLVYTNELVMYLANGVTTVREMWGSTGHIAYRDRITSGEVPGPWMYIGSPGMDSVASWPRTIVITNPVKADTLIAQLVRDHFDFVKVYEFLSGAVYDSIVAAASRRGIKLAGHVGYSVGVTRALAAGQRSIEHMASAYLPEVRAAGNTNGWWDSPISDARVQQLAQRIASSSTWATPTLATLEAMLTPNEEAALLRRPEARYLAPALVSDWVVRGPWGNASAREAAIANESRAAKIFFDAGVKLLVGSDAGFTYMFPGFAIHDELRLLVNAGIPAGDVLFAATQGAARFVGGANVFGSVAAGMRADLLLLDANPLDDIANAKRRAGVMASGRWYSDTELTRMLEAQISTSAAARNERVAPRGYLEESR